MSIPADLDLIESVPGKLGGTPVIVGTRIPSDLIASLCGDGTIPFDCVSLYYPGVTEEAARQAWTLAHRRHPKRFPAF